VVREHVAPYNTDGIVPEGHDFGGYGILVDSGDCGGFPSFSYDEKTGDDFEIDLVTLVGEHLAEGEVAIFMEAGAEKLRYVIGWAQAINWKGEIKTISLTDIYDIAKTMTDRPDSVTVAEY